MRKKCFICKAFKELAEFSKDKYTTDGYCGKCKKCRSLIRKKEYQKNFKQILQKAKIYRDKNQKHINFKQRESRRKFPWRYTLVDIKKRCNNKNCDRYKDYGR